MANSHDYFLMEIPGMREQVREYLKSLDTLSPEVQAQLEIALYGGGISLIAVAFLPAFLIYYFLAFGTYFFIYSLPNWLSVHKAASSAAELPPKELTLAAFLIFSYLAIDLSRISGLSQIGYCTLLGTILGGGFAHAIHRSQINLNNALLKAVADLKIDEARILLERGADPFAVDATHKNAFQLSIKNNAAAVAMLEILVANSKAEKSYGETVIEKFKAFFNEERRSTWTLLGQQLLQFGKDLTPENQAPIIASISTLYQSYHLAFKDFIGALTLYAREQYKTSLQLLRKQDLQTLNAMELIGALAIDQQYALAMRALLMKMQPHGAETSSPNSEEIYSPDLSILPQFAQTTPSPTLAADELPGPDTVSTGPKNNR